MTNGQTVQDSDVAADNGKLHGYTVAGGFTTPYGKVLLKSDPLGTPGNTIAYKTPNALNAIAATVQAGGALSVNSGGSVTLEAASNTRASTSFLEKKESGFLSGGGFGVTYGSREQSTDNKGQGTTAAASTVGSIKGNVTVNAGQAYRQVGSDVSAPAGDVTITTKKVDIVEARETTNSTTEQNFKQNAFTLEITSPVLSAVQTMSQMAEAAGNTSSGRMQAMAAANAGFAANNAANAIKAGQGSLINGKEGQIATTNADGSTGRRDAKSGGVGEQQKQFHHRRHFKHQRHSEQRQLQGPVL